MNGAGSVNKLEKHTMNSSVLHTLDGRVKLIILLLIIVYAVYTTDLIVLLMMEVYLIAMIAVSHLSFKESFKRVLFILPFGGAVALFQPFVLAGTIIYTGPSGNTCHTGRSYVWSAFNVQIDCFPNMYSHIILVKSHARSGELL